MPDNKSLTPPEGASQTGFGSGVLIGDGIMLTAGHVMYEFNEKDDPQDRQIRKLSGSDIFWDPRDYYSQYHSQMTGLSNPLPIPNSGGTISAELIEPNLLTDDLVFVTRNGTVDDSDAGMALYLDPGDITAQDGSLVSGARYRRWGQKTNTETVDWQTLSLSLTGLTWTDSSAHLQPGDSGGANWIDFEGKEYIVGNNVWIDQLPPDTTISNASYITSAEFYGLHALMQATNQLGNVTTEEPTNLIIGSSNSDANANGTYRPDIILGKGGNDQLWDGEQADDLVWADDQLFGGGGNDSFHAANGNDLLHGGDHRTYSGSNQRTWAIEADGVDSVDYGDFVGIPRSSDDPGLELRIGAASGSIIPAWVYGDETDQDLASYVIDRQHDASNAFSFGTDALISIEEVLLSASDDVLTINEIGTARWAGQDGTGGIATVDFGGNATFDGSSERPGDVVDASNLGASDDVRIDLAAGIVSAVPGNGPNGQNIPSISITGAESAFGGAGDDELTGDANGNRLDGGAGADNLDGGAGDDFLVFEEGDASVDGGDGFDTAILFAGLDPSGNAIGGTFEAHRLGISNIERVIFTEGDDHITVSNSDYVINGGGGDDYIDVSGRDPITIEFGRGGGHDFIDGLFMENHDLNDWVIHGVGENNWLDARQSDTIKFVDLLPTDISLVWDFTQAQASTDPNDIYRDGQFAIVINDTGESIQFSELFASKYEDFSGKSIFADYGPQKRGGLDWSEQDPDNYNYEDPALFDNYTELKIFEFADGNRYSIVDLFELDTVTAAPLPASAANPNQSALSATSLALPATTDDASGDFDVARTGQLYNLERQPQSQTRRGFQAFATVDEIFDMIRTGRDDVFDVFPDSSPSVGYLPEEATDRPAVLHTHSDLQALDSSDPSIAQRLALVRQDLSVFGAAASGQISARNWQVSNSMEFYA